MRGSRNQLVLSLIAGLLLLEAILLAYNLARHFASPSYTYWRVAIVLAILFGLWLHSNYARFLGGAWLVFSSAAVAWPLITPKAFVWNPFLIWMVSYLALGLISSYFLLLSKPFGVEFKLLREARPKWKILVGKTFAVAVALVAVVATLLDIYNLANT